MGHSLGESGKTVDAVKTTVKDVYDLLNEIAPFTLREPWDNCGLQAGNFSWPVKKILVALDASMAAMAHAVSINADLLLTHHPLLLRAPNSVDFSVMPGSAVALAAVEKISIISAHTNLDKARGGLNDFFAHMAGLKNLTPLSADDCGGAALLEGKVAAKNIEEANPDILRKDNFDQHIEEALQAGIGRIGILEKTVSLRAFAADLKKAFDVDNIRITGDPEMKVRHVAVCTGSGGSLLKEFFISGADVYVTGDIKYHEARDVEAAGLGLVDLGHFASERISVNLLAGKMGTLAIEKGMDLNIQEYKGESDPFFTL